MSDKRFTCAPAAHDNIDHTRREACFFGELGNQEGGTQCDLRWSQSLGMFDGPPLGRGGPRKRTDLAAADIYPDPVAPALNQHCSSCITRAIYVWRKWVT